MSFGENLASIFAAATANPLKSQLSALAVFGGLGMLGGCVAKQGGYIGEKTNYPKIDPTIVSTVGGAIGVLSALAYSSYVGFDQWLLGCAAVGAVICKGGAMYSNEPKQYEGVTGNLLAGAAGTLIATILYTGATAAAGLYRG